MAEAHDLVLVDPARLNAADEVGIGDAESPGAVGKCPVEHIDEGVVVCEPCLLLGGSCLGCTVKSPVESPAQGLPADHGKCDQCK